MRTAKVRVRRETYWWRAGVEARDGPVPVGVTLTLVRRSCGRARSTFWWTGPAVVPLPSAGVRG
ncbi:hypothetical protein ACFWXK_11195 [Streptomyces sp. NPDC059070]|uniref:hypothetical protein n=1 Tax=Streptomyces sp. NPDC059070 TaxID=3346713 RepID=UPI0036A74990